jgi:hypothetical protein
MGGVRRTIAALSAAAERQPRSLLFITLIPHYRNTCWLLDAVAAGEHHDDEKRGSESK